tara:strand:- start:175 stop:699 length:525 start_codon:yes stop_codon:yes gene_type:complete
MELSKLQFIKDNQVKANEENMYIIENYPYGFNKKTIRRSYIETNERRGDRIIHQTLNPKTKEFNKPKKSTYSEVIIAYINEDSKLDFLRLSNYDELNNEQSEFIKNNFNLSNNQKKQINNMTAFHKVMKNVTWTVKPVSINKEERENNKKNHDKNINKLVKHLNYEAHVLNKAI